MVMLMRDGMPAMALLRLTSPQRDQEEVQTVLVVRHLATSSVKKKANQSHVV